MIDHLTLLVSAARWPLALALALALAPACTGGTPDDDDDDDDDGATDDTAGDGGSTAPDGGTTGETTAETIVLMETSLGALELTLRPDLAPVTVANFLAYVDSGFYDGRDGAGATVIHRVDADFVFQGGFYDQDGDGKDTMAPIPLETDVGLSNVRGSLAMARTSDPDSATSSFYVNIADNTFLDYQDADSPGYAVFGQVTAGLDVVDAIAQVKVDGETPVESILITSALQP